MLYIEIIILYIIKEIIKLKVQKINVLYNKVIRI